MKGTMSTTTWRCGDLCLSSCVLAGVFMTLSVTGFNTGKPKACLSLGRSFVHTKIDCVG